MPLLVLKKDNNDARISSNIETLKTPPTRPNLSVVTQSPKTKTRSWHKIFNKEKTRFGNKDTPITHVSDLHQYSDDVKLAGSPVSTSDSSTHSNHGVQNILHKFQFHKRKISQYSDESIASSIDYDQQIPEVPDHIMPELVNWSPEAPLLPPPWELNNDAYSHKPAPSLYKRQSVNTLRSLASLTLSSLSYDKRANITNDKNEESIIEPDIGYQSDSEILDYSDSAERDSDITFVEEQPSRSSTQSTTSNSSLTNSSGLRRRSSCPTYDTLSLDSTPSATSSSKTAVDNDIISITEQHTRHMSVLKKYVHPVDKVPVFKTCQKAKARAQEAAANGTLLPSSIYTVLCDDALRHFYIPNVFDPATHEPILEFSNIKPRKYELKRKISWKKEARALMKWRDELQENLRRPPVSTGMPKGLPTDRIEKNLLTRKFILREFFTTEVNFWNQLYYSKIIFYDSFITALNRKSPFSKESTADIFANLFDMMQFSAKLINRLRHFQFHSEKEEVANGINCNNICIGEIIVDMAEDFTVFLRCAIDFGGNRKVLEEANFNKGYQKYRQKLQLNKETSYFTLSDYLIIPIQRVARYGLLLADILKHTAPEHPDYDSLINAHRIVSSLASAMNFIQKKS